MCLSQTQSAPPIQPPPMSLPGASAPDPNVPGGDTGPNSLGNALDASRTPQAANVKTPTKAGRAVELLTGGAYDPTGGVDTGQAPTSPNGGTQPTKFGALLKLITPMMQGATVGGFLGKSTRGGGFAAAQNLFMQQRMMQMQRNQFAINLMKLQSEVQKNQAEAQWAQRRPMVTRTAPVIKGEDDQGNPIFKAQNPQTGDYENVGGIHPSAGPSKEVNTDQGMVTYDPANPKAGAVPLTLGPQVGNPSAAKNNPAEGSDESASEPSARAAGSGVPVSFGNIKPSAHDSGSPRLPAVPIGSPSQSPGAIAATGGGVPLHAPGFANPKPTKVTNRNATGQETDNLVDENPNSPTYGQVVKKGVASRSPLPDRAANRDNVKTKVAGQVEEAAGYALDNAKGDPDAAIALVNKSDMDPSKKALVRQRIRERVKAGKPKTGKQSLADMLNGTKPPNVEPEPEEDEEN